MADGTFLDTHGKNLNILPEMEHIIIKELAMPEEIRALSEKISYEVMEEDFISSFKGWKECTSTSPLGHHLGHYKAMINNPDRKQEPEQHKQEIDMVALMVNMINILLKYGFAPHRWCKLITMMIKKDPGNPHIEWLRVIHLFKADYNFSLKLLWGHRLVYQGEDNKCFGHQQYGSRPQHQAIDAVHKKMLTYDLSRTMHLALLIFDNDASGCFNRIIVALATIAALQLAFPWSAMQMHAKALIGMQYFVKTAHSFLDAFYKVTHLFQLFGMGQGSGASPAIWLTIVICFLSALTAMAPITMTFMDPWGNIFDEQNVESYVDDMSLGCNDAHLREQMCYKELIKYGQESAQIWERILYSSGGALELWKCFWYLLHWQWVKGQPQLATKLETPGMIALTSSQVPVYTVIPHKEVWVAHCTLGVQPAPDGNYRKEGAFLLNKANQYASCLSASSLSEMDTFIFHHSTYVPSMMYSLPLTTFTPTELNKIQCKVIQSILNKLGMNKSFPHRVAFNPKDLYGLALLDISIDQGVHQIQHFLNHIFAADSVGNLILIALQCLQLEAGCSFHILEHPNEYLPYITLCWLTSIQDFLAQHKIVLKVTVARLTVMSCINDQHLMDDFRSLGIFNNDQLYDLNLCRLYLQVTTLSDIMDGPGNRIIDEAFKAKHLTNRYSVLCWPRQPVLTMTQSNLWKQALKVVYTSSGQILKQPLGKWTGPPTQLWQNFYDPSTSHIVTSTPVAGNDKAHQFIEYIATTSTQHHVMATPIPSVVTYASLPTVDWNTVIPAMVTFSQSSSVTVTYHEQVTPERVIPSNPWTFTEQSMLRHSWTLSAGCFIQSSSLQGASEYYTNAYSTTRF